MIPALKLNTNTTMPMIGLGTYQCTGNEVKQAVEFALSSGYRHFDTASVYKNEKEIGEVLSNKISLNEIKRSELFIVSKLYAGDHGFDEAIAAFDRTLENLSLEYLDLYLIHWPGVTSLSVTDPSNKKLRKQSWLALEKIFNSGKAKAIGVSNYEKRHLKDLFSYCSIKPAVNQIEFHPLLVQNDLLKYCCKHNIVLESYSTLGRGEIVNNASIGQLAHRYHKFPSQIILRWAYQKGIPTIPKSKTKNFISQNIDIFNFELNIADIELIDKLNSNLRYCWDPSVIS